MQQLTQKLKKGQIDIREVSLPMVPSGHILVRNHFSLISAGTEGSTVATARKSLIGKARARPQQAKQVLDVLRSQGPKQTYRTVMKKLDAYSPLGYSSAGEVVAMANDVVDFHVGDYVACAGATASHAEYVSIPVNLAVKVDKTADMKAAAYNAVGAIAMQGVRRAELALGESCAVIGLGLIGQLTAMMLKASGVKVIGIDIDQRVIDATLNTICDAAWARNTPGLAEKIDHFTQELGVDAVIITAGTSSLDPINFAGRISRKRGRVVVVGAVPTGFERDPHYYRKELDLRMSCSYGPGRYDPSFEDKGIDYPAAYVRWTEKRNMDAFQKLIHTKAIDVSSLTTHTFDFEKAADAYEIILNRSELYFGILLAYDTGKTLELNAPKKINPPSLAQNGISFIGAGSYAQSFLLPNIRGQKNISLRGVATNTGTTSQRVADKYGFDYCTDDPQVILDDDESHTLFIATRHDSHAQYVIDALTAKKHVYVEKPLCLTTEELIEISRAYDDSEEKLHVMVGFNRRFAPLITKLKGNLDKGPMAVTYRVNAGAIPQESWIQDTSIGGGRIVGEACHFVDLITHLTGSLPKQIYASAMRNAASLEDTVSINIEFENGSIGTIHYFANGNKSLAKEYIEVFQDGCSYIVDDFKTLIQHNSAKKETIEKLASQDKGQKEMIAQFIERIHTGGQPLISFSEIFSVNATCFATIRSIRERAPVAINNISDH